MLCAKCSAEIDDLSRFCMFCGKSTTPRQKSVKKRGNGQGSVTKSGNGYRAIKTIGWEMDENGKRHKPIRISKTFPTKREAVDALPSMMGVVAPRASTVSSFKQIYDLWLPNYERLGRTQSTLNCYKAAYKHMAELYDIPFADICIDDLQECLDDCEQGRRTKENMRALFGLLYKYAIPRRVTQDNTNLAEYLIITGDPSERREEFRAEEIEIVRKAVGFVPYADYIYCQMHLGFRPHEFLSLRIERYDKAERAFIGGEKTEAGRDRLVTVSPKIQPMIDKLIAGRKEGFVFCGAGGAEMTLKRYRTHFSAALSRMGLPLGGRKLTPHCCRHTFATLMKQVDAPDVDKLALIGHTSVEMLSRYQHSRTADLRRITDAI